MRSLTAAFAMVAFITNMNATTVAAQTATTIANKNLRIVAESQGPRIVLKMQTPTGADVLVAGPPGEMPTHWKSILRPELFARLSGKDETLFLTNVELLQRPRSLRLSGSSKSLSFTRQISLVAEYPAAYVVDTWRIGPAAKVEALLSSFNFAPRGKSYEEIKPLDFVWTPNLRPQPNDIIADHVFRSPAIMLQKDSVFVALIPDVHYLIKHRAMPMAMDFQLPPLQRSNSAATDTLLIHSPSDSANPITSLAAALEIEPAAPILSFGFWPWKVRDHVYYQPDSTRAPQLQDTEVSYAYYLWLDYRAAPWPRPSGFPQTSTKSKGGGTLPFHRVVDFLWEKFSPLYRQENLGALPGTLDQMAQRAWKQYAEQTWFETKLNGRSVGGLKSGRLAWSNGLPEEVNNDVWFSSWFQTLRTAYGMYLYGKRNRDVLLMDRAEKVLNLALAAPMEGGIFPSIYYYSGALPRAQENRGGTPSPIRASVLGTIEMEKTAPALHHWVGDEGWAGFGNDYNHTFDASWTGYWLLQWAELLPQRRQEILAFSRQYADFLLKWQQPSGVIPSWFHRRDNQPRPEFFNENAETAGSALFLAEFFARVKEQPYLTAAIKAMDYITREILPYNKWFDFETFTSCSRKPFDDFDPITGQYPQNTLSMHQAAKAYLALHKITGKSEYLHLGTQVLDYLLLYQQVWSPPFLSRHLLGGFGVQNTDGEWSDARQAYFADTMMDYYETTGKRAYFERAVEALRATFALFHRDTPMCYENWAHGGSDSPGAITGIHWGTGSAATSFELLRERMGDAYIFIGDTPRAAWACGVNALWIENLKIAADTISFDLLSTLKWGRRVKIKFDGVAPGRYRVKINGEPWGPFPDKLLTRGIVMEVKRVPAVTHIPPQHFYSRSPKPLQLRLEATGTKADFAPQLYLRAELPSPSGKSGKAASQAIPFKNISGQWVAKVPETYTKDGHSFFYSISWNRGRKSQRLPSATMAEEFYRAEVQPFMFADCGDDDEAYLGEEKDSWISAFDGGKKDRVADGEQWFSYVFPIQTNTQRVKVTFAANGECRFTAGDSLFLDEGDSGRGELTEHTFEMNDPQLWAGGKLVLRFGDANPQDGWGANVGWIKVEEIAAMP